MWLAALRVEAAEPPILSVATTFRIVDKSCHDSSYWVKGKELPITCLKNLNSMLPAFQQCHSSNKYLPSMVLLFSFIPRKFTYRLQSLELGF
ncbi:hypothetical protein AHAS_Ahas19G0151400 [Arachis hypogaea]